VNAQLSRSSPEQVYQLILADLEAAKNNLGTNYTQTGQRVRANKWSATALMARVHLYRGEWAAAAAAADEIIQSGTYRLEQLTGVFLSSSREAILQLTPPNANLYTWDGNVFYNGAHQLTPGLMNAFETADKRKTSWTRTVTTGSNTSYFTYKYKVNSGAGTTKTEYTVLFRLAEQYLIRAEANAQLENLPAAITDVDSIRQRAGLPLLSVTKPGISRQELLDQILQERRSEFFTELGHRWYDVKRTGKADQIFGAVKPNWRPEAALYPIPLRDILRDNKLTQNKGYY
jgi:starch-binding outer membrane protein, SusD/RagB family